jgi:hypothetical protein
MKIIIIFAMLMSSIIANSAILHDGGWKIAINPENFSLTAITQNENIQLTKLNNHKVSNFSKKENAISWSWPDRSIDFTVHLSGKNLVITISTDKIQEFQWLNQVPNDNLEAYILPLGEGVYVPVKNKDWISHLDGSKYNTEDSMSIPYWSQLYKNLQLNFTLINPYNNTLEFNIKGNSLALKTSHDFVKIDKSPMRILISLDENKDLLSGAKEYRHILELKNSLITLSKKLNEVDDGDRILGASQIYIWGDDIFGYKDIRDISGLIQWLKSDQGKIIFSKFSNDIQNSLSALLQEKPDSRLKYSFITAINSALYKTTVPYQKSFSIKEEFDNAEKAKVLTSELIGKYLTDPKSWGNGFSTTLVDKLHKSGLKKLWLAANDWRDCLLHTDAVKLANSYGYLTAVYDSYNTAVPNGINWKTAEMGEDILKNGAIIDKNGKPVIGFGDRGVYSNLAYVDNFMKKRIADVLKYTNINSYFLDVEGTATAFDDYSPNHTTTKPEMIKQRNDRLGWVEKKYKIPVGSEGGNALTSSELIFAQGLALTPLLYWQWPKGNIFNNRKSKYYLGNYSPHQEPTLFFKPQPNIIKPVYTIYFDPAYRLPLYQIVLHDSVILSSHWQNGLLKYPTVQSIRMLKTLLYMNAPLYHLNWNTLSKRLPIIVEFDKVFRPLHERLATVQMIDFKYLSKDKLLQATYFADESRIIVNFSGKSKKFESKNKNSGKDKEMNIEGYTMIAEIPGEKIVVYNAN